VDLDWSTRTDAGSVSKILGTTAALLALVDAGAVDLDAPMARYLPLPGLEERQISPRDLLEHQGGLWEWWPLYLSGARRGAAVELAAALPSRYPPGSGRHYSDLGFILLGELVARVGGGDLATVVDDLVLRPFGLTETRYAAPTPGGPVAAGSLGDAVEYEMVESGRPYPMSGAVTNFPRWRRRVLVGEVNDGNSFHAFDGVAGHAGLFTTAADLLRFGSGLLESLAGHGPVRPQTVRTFLTPGRDPGQALAMGPGLRAHRVPGRGVRGAAGSRRHSHADHQSATRRPDRPRFRFRFRSRLPPLLTPRLPATHRADVATGAGRSRLSSVAAQLRRPAWT
jgi:serine-type D-Ala-D-Ala carboxypeptidase